MAKPMIDCPHCGASGSVTVEHKKQKKGLSGGKSTGALLTGGVSMLATGLSRKEEVTVLTCKKCTVKWVA
jgi:transcription elongation factor Elf1